MMDASLRYWYYNPKSPAYLSSVDGLYRYARKKGVTKAHVKEFLNKQSIYTLHKPLKKHFLRNKTIPIGLDSDWQLDLMDVSAISKHNNGNRYLLTAIDVLSRFSFVQPVTSKKSEVIAEAFRKILKRSGRKPMWVFTDMGGEFLGKPFQEFLNENNIYQKTASNTETKASLVERYNRTLGDILWKFFTHKKTLNYTKILQALVYKLNNRFHRAIGMKPSEVNADNERELWNKNYSGLLLSKDKPAFLIGDKVRIAKLQTKFRKGRLKTFSDEIFTITKIKYRKPIVYEICDAAEQPILGTFYKEELIKV